MSGAAIVGILGAQPRVKLREVEVRTHVGETMFKRAVTAALRVSYHDYTSVG